MMLRLFFVGMPLVLAAGCSEGTKPDPLPRAGTREAGTPAPAVPIPVDKAPAAGLYERLGGEEGLTQTVRRLAARLDADAKTQGLTAKFKKRALVDFLMEASSKPRPHLADHVMLSWADWSLLIPALRATLDAQDIPAADRDELLANIEKSR